MPLLAIIALKPFLQDLAGAPYRDAHQDQGRGQDQGNQVLHDVAHVALHYCCCPIISYARCLSYFISSP